MERDSKRFRVVNSSLGKAPKVGFFPADQVVPWTAIAFSSYYVGKLILGLSWIWVGTIAAWGISTWWILTGSKGWRFLSKFVATPTWTRGYAKYERVLSQIGISSKKIRRLH
ncbi:MAG TPA: hypothetical protein V6D15_10910 [Oculatellaceae cyanobacterium]|jgi:hypothetical protein